MEGILDFSQDLDVSLLDRVVTCLFSGGPEHKQAQQVLTQFQDHPDSWQRVDQILEKSQSMNTKFLALQVLEKFIQTRWKVLPADNRNAIRYFIVNVIVKVSSDETTLVREKTYLNKLNMVLVQILKQEWPQNWPAFIPEIVASSKTNLALCENNMAILKLLSEEIFDFSAEQMTQQKTNSLKNQMCGEFSEIFQLCKEVLDRAQKPSLIKATLQTLLRFLNWIPLGFIFETDLIETLTNRFFEVAEFRNVTLKCLTEIGSLEIQETYNEKLVVLFNIVMGHVNTMIPPSTDIAAIYDASSDDDQEFIQNLAMFLTSFLGAHLKTIEQAGNHELLINAHFYLIKISRVPDREIWKICLEYWSKLVLELYEEVQALPIMDTPVLNLGGAGAPVNNYNLRKHLYADILSNLRLVMIERMVKPEEVLIVENDEGEIVREFVRESDTITLYKAMREALVYLTHLDVIDTEEIMKTKLARQMDGSEWSWNNLNQLCWAIGSISGAMSEETEKRFLVTVIKDLLTLTEMKRGKDNKAVVASNIMYIVGQYPRFLKAHWKFLKTVVNKLFEFMHETHEGVQDMACDTFIKIAQKCKRHFVLQQAGEAMPFIDEILDTIDKITRDLSPQQIHTFYEAVGYMISAQPVKQTQERLIVKFMEMPNRAWDDIMQQARSNGDVLNNPENIKILGNVLKTNVSACSSIGQGYFVQLGKIYFDLMGLYKAVSELVSNTVAQQGVIAAKTPKVRGLRTIKKEVLKLIDTYVKVADDLQAVKDNMIPPLFEAVLSDYKANIDVARDAEVLNVMTTIVKRLGGMLTNDIPTILEYTFEPTLNMINKDFSEYPEHRAGFYNLLREINLQCFPALIPMLPKVQFKLIVDSIVWGFKHTMREIADLGLQICLELLGNFSKTDVDIASEFYRRYYLSILQDVFFVLTDTDHKSGFKYQTEVLARLFQLVQDGEIHTPLYDPSSVPDPAISNAVFLREYVTNLLRNAFPHLQPNQINVFVMGMFQYNNEPLKFKQDVRDFLIELKEFAGDTSDLFLAEREAEQELIRDREREKLLAVPGLVKPSELPDNNMED